MAVKIAEGIFELLISKAIRAQLELLKPGQVFIGERKIDKVETAHILSNYLSGILRFSMLEIKGDDALDRQIEFANDLIQYVHNKLSVDIAGDLIDVKGRILNYVLSSVGRTDKQLADLIERTFPQTGLTVSSLFTGSNSDLSIDTEIEKDILSSDGIYWIVSFIRWSGIRIFEHALKEFTRRQNARLRIITTTYLGASEPKALEFLANLPNTEIKVSYQTQIERLHAKSYFFERVTGFDVAYIGSSNLSKSALTKGLEWNIRVTSVENRHIIEKAKATFEHYWNSPDFENFTIDDLPKFKEALRNEGWSSSDIGSNEYLKLQPFAFQKEILDKLKTEREIHNRFRNLVVAATGTGKTVIAAFDYKRFKDANSGKANLLFVAHRKEILEQARAVFRSVLAERDFGELWVGQYVPHAGDLSHLFISVQTFNARMGDILERCPPDFFDFLVLDEAHHSTAESYRMLLETYQPKILLGLTATPERMDGNSLLPDFDGKIAAEIRLPDAVGMKLLTPFQYFCVTDESVNLKGISWSSGRYDIKELTNVLSIDARVRLVVDAIQHYLVDPRKCRALCFCTSKEHAVFMSNALNRSGFKSAFLLGESNNEERDSLRRRLVQRDLNFLCVVDIYNEGVDIPEVDTVLFLRPTESLTIFLQQLGRGLRISADKECLTVLDFVSQAHQNYNFAQKFRALVGRSNSHIKREIEGSFPHVPAGCTIRMEKQAKEYILENIRNAIFDARRIRKEVASFAQNTHLPLTLSNFLSYHEIDIRTIYKASVCWSTLKRDAGILSFTDSEMFEIAARGIRRLVSIDSPTYLQFIKGLLQNGFCWDYANVVQNRLALMFYYDVWQKGILEFGFSSIENAIKSLNEYPIIVQELNELIDYLFESIDHSTSVIDFSFPNVLELHARYSRDQILAAYFKSTPEQPFPAREGVVPIPEINAELLLVTLEKSEKDFSPSTQYEDYAINERIFHWQSQNRTSPESSVGLSYINHSVSGKEILLFVRERNKDSFGFTCPYYFLGPVSYHSHKGSKPMSIIWNLDNEMPAHLWHAAAKVAVG